MLRTFQAGICKNLRTSQSQQKITGPYIKKECYFRFDRRKTKCAIWLRKKQTKHGRRNGMKKEALRMSMALQKAFGRPKEAVPKNYKNSFERKKTKGNLKIAVRRAPKSIQREKRKQS